MTRQQALREMVTESQDFIAVEFPRGAKWPEREQIRKALIDKGFETED